MRILAFAYACEPDKGSEPGAGWNWARLLTTFGDVWVVTRANNRSSIEAILPSLPERDSLHFVYIDLPEWMRSWKKGHRGVRTYYLIWMVLARRTALKLHRETPFDVAWHLTFANVWLGSLAPLPGAGFIFGPVGGGVDTAWNLLPLVGGRGAMYEIGRSIQRTICRYVNPLVRFACRRADLILVQNEDTYRWLSRRYRGKAEIFPAAVLEGSIHIPADTDIAKSSEVTRALFVGRLLPWKGVAIAIKAVALRGDTELLICGSGRDEARLHRLVQHLSVENRVRFLQWIPHEEVLRVMREEADLLLFPSIHDDAPFAVVEALSQGLPVVCLNRGGPPFLSDIGGIAVSADDHHSTVVQNVATAIGKVVKPNTAERRSAPQVAQRFQREERVKQLAELVASLPSMKVPS